MSYLTIEGLNLDLGGKTILKNMNFTVEKGQLVTLLGPSGCGKSTLLRAISGLTPAQKGRILIDGRDISQVIPKKRDIGMVFQSYALFPNLTVRDNIAFGLTMKKISKSEINRKVASILDLVGLKEKADAYPAELSGGQQQRVALARSIVVEPKVLLLDEPLSALDAQIRKQLRVELCRLQRKIGITMIFVTHDQEEAMAISDRIFIMDSGQITQEGTPGDIYFHPDNVFVAGFIGNYNTIDREQAVQLFGATLETDAQIYAIRPESIALEPQEGAAALLGTVFEQHILGNVVRYSVRTEKGELCVDRMSRDEESLMDRRQIMLYIRKEDVVPLQS